MHPLAVGVIVRIALSGELVLFVAVKAGMFPVPEAARPMAVLLLVQVKVVPVMGPDSTVDGAVFPLQ